MEGYVTRNGNVMRYCFLKNGRQTVFIKNNDKWMDGNMARLVFIYVIFKI